MPKTQEKRERDKAETGPDKLKNSEGINRNQDSGVKFTSETWSDRRKENGKENMTKTQTEVLHPLRGSTRKY